MNEFTLKRNFKLDLVAAVFRLLQENPRDTLIIEKIKQANEEIDKFKAIRCPHCKWQPQDSSKWLCSDCDHPEYYYGGCHTSWNSFDTEGVCPGCSHKWIWTTCLSCYEWSLHKDWYVDEQV